MFSKFVKIKTDNPDLDDVQQNVARVLDPLYTVPIHDGIYLRDISLSAGSNRVLHKLERDYIGFIVCNARPTNAGGSSTAGWTSFTPSITGSGSLTWATSSTESARYRIDGNTCDVQIRVTGTTGGVTSNTLNIVPPVLMDSSAATSSVFTHAYVNDGGGLTGLLGLSYTTNQLSVFRDAAGTNYGLGAGRILSFSASYQISPTYGLDTQVIEGISTTPSVSLNLICGSPMTASILVY